MYKWEVCMFIEELKNGLKETCKYKNDLSHSSKDFIKCASRSLNVLKSCTHFSWTDKEYPLSLIPSDIKGYLKGLHLPFPQMTISYSSPFYSDPEEQAIEDIMIPGVAILEEVIEGLFTISFWNSDKNNLHKAHKNGWIPIMHGLLVSLKGNFCDFKEAIDYYNSIGYSDLANKMLDSDINVLVIDNYGVNEDSLNFKEEEKENDYLYVVYDVQHVIFPFLYLLNARNMPIKEHRSLKSYSISSGAKLKNRPIIYKTIDLNFPMDTKYKYPTNNNKSDGTKRLHLCRGHVRHYTKEQPLFGRYSGPVWCPHHFRGSSSKGLNINKYQGKKKKNKKKRK